MMTAISIKNQNIYLLLNYFNSLYYNNIISQKKSYIKTFYWYCNLILKKKSNLKINIIILYTKNYIYPIYIKRIKLKNKLIRI